MAEGDWSKGERLLAVASGGPTHRSSTTSWRARRLSCKVLTGARDDWLKLAYEELPEAETAVLLTQAECNWSTPDYELHLPRCSAYRKPTRIIPGAGAAARIHHALEDWERLLALGPRLADARMDTGEMEGIVAAALEANIAEQDITRVDVDRLWGRLPAALRKAPRLIALQGLALNSLGQGEEAEKKIRQALKRGWEEPLVLAYGRVRGAKADKQLLQAEKWLKQRPEDGALLLSAARLCMVLELWGKARSYLETSLAIAPRTEAYALYGRLLDQFGEADNAALAFRSGLSLAVGAGDDLPALGSPDAAAQAGQKKR